MCLYEVQISGERLQDHWPSGFCLFSEVLNPGSSCSYPPSYDQNMSNSATRRLKDICKDMHVLQKMFDDGNQSTCRNGAEAQ